MGTLKPAQLRSLVRMYRQKVEGAREQLVSESGWDEGLAVDAYRKGLRVLWVVNTVDRCQRLARSLASELGAAVPAYHSRFKLAHRQKKHAKVDRKSVV